MLHSDFNWTAPDYLRAVEQRIAFVTRMRADPSVIPALKIYYKANPADFISDFGVTHDPRNVNNEKPSFLPFILFPKQVDWIKWATERWANDEAALTEKSRDMGLSWLSVALACTLCLFHNHMAIGFGSRKESYVDELGSPKALFPKARLFLKNLPVEFRGGWKEDRDAPHMRIHFPQTSSTISGESGDNIGRGDRAAIYFVDEAAFLERPELIDAALSQTTNCRIDISSANGTANSFYRKRVDLMNSDKLFTFHWRDDPRKDQAWYDKTVAAINNPIIVASEIDINYSASIEGVLIPSSWVQSAIDAHKLLGFGYDGARFGALDVADEGKDKNAFCGAHGVIINHLEEWSGKGSDPAETTQKAFMLCDLLGYRSFRYDAIGIGADVRGVARLLNEQRKGRPSIRTDAFKAAGKLFQPDSKVPGMPISNADYFSNPKAQGWWHLRGMFQRTFMAVQAKKAGEYLEFDTDELISIESGCLHVRRATEELSQVTFKMSTAGKLVINKAPDDAASPNLADAIMMRFAPMKQAMAISNDALAAIKRTRAA